MSKPFFVQAHRPASDEVWRTDKRYGTKEEAIEAAMRLHEDWGRTVRVVDEDERLLFRYPPKARVTRRRRPV